MRPLVRARTVVAAAAVVAAVGGACGGGGGSGPDDAGGRGGAQVVAPADVSAALCDAAEAADGGDLDRARTEFEDVHADLHAVSDDLGDRDREAAADLLRAKQRVEAGLAAGEAPGRVSSELRALAGVVAAAEVDAVDGGDAEGRQAREPCR